jgi:energy-coupling factor transport system substrate-specific component
MLGWGVVGLLGAALGRAGLGGARFRLALACAAAGLAFGAWMDLFTLLNFAAERSGGSYAAIAAVSLPFNIAHAAGNALLCLTFGPGFVRLLARYRRRLEVRWQETPVPALGGAAGAALLAVVLVSTLHGAEPARAATGVGAAVRYLERAQNADGGFGGAPGQRSNQLLTGWSVIGLEAAGRNPLDLERGGRSAVDYMRERLGELRDTGELERTVIALRGAGIDARGFGGRDLLSELLRKQRENGSFEGYANWTAFGILALRAAGRSARSPAVEHARRYLVRSQGNDGGFPVAVRGASDVDDTGAALQALASVGRRHSPPARRAIAYLRQQQNPDGGFGQLRGGRSNAQSTAWATQGLVAAGVDPARFGRHRSPLRYLGSLQQSDGSFRYSRTSAQTPVWVTAQAVAALRRKPLPLAPVRRSKGHVSQRAPVSARDRTRPRSAARAEPHRVTSAPGARPRTGGASLPVNARPAAARTEREDESSDPLLPWAAVAVGAAIAGGGAALFLRGRRSLHHDG